MKRTSDASEGLNTNHAPSQDDAARERRESRGTRQNGDRHRTQWVLIAAFCVGLTAPATGWGQLIVDFSSGTTISSISPSMTLSVRNSDLVNPVSLGGVNFFVKVQDGGPTISTTPASGVDLLTGTLFSGLALGGQFAVGTPTSLSQGWGVIAFPVAASLAAGQTKQLGTITFDSFPTGDWLLDFGDPSVGVTAFADASGNTIDVNHLLGTVTVVPEPQAYALVVGFGLLAVALAKRSLPRSRHSKG